MAHYPIPIEQCDEDIGEVHVEEGDTIQWHNNTGRRVQLTLPRKILQPANATEVIPAGGVSSRYEVVSKAHPYDFKCLGTKRVAPRTGTIIVG